MFPPGITCEIGSFLGTPLSVQLIHMNPFERYVQLCGEIGHYTECITGANLVDAYTGPDKFSPEGQKRDCDAPTLLHEIGILHDRISAEVDDELRQQYLLGELDSFWTTVRWLSGEPMLYSDIVEGMFNIPMRGFHEREITHLLEDLEDKLQSYPGEDLFERVHLFTQQGKVLGEELKTMIEIDLQQKSKNVGELFKERIFTLMGREVTDNGVEYRCVSDKPWSGYNWYQRGFKSLNEFNVDRSFNKDTLASVIYHEYEHHVSNLWRERLYHDTGNIELSIVPMHTGRCVISEGTADTARDFLGIAEGDERTQIVNTLSVLRRMTSINAAIMLNAENKTREDAISYMIERGLRDADSAKGSIAFIQPFQSDERPNFYAPYVFTYFFGRTDFVLPTFQKAKQEDQLPEFYRTIYLNPYTGSSLTWGQAFEWL